MQKRPIRKITIGVALLVTAVLSLWTATLVWQPTGPDHRHQTDASISDHVALAAREPDAARQLVDSMARPSASDLEAKVAAINRLLGELSRSVSKNTENIEQINNELRRRPSELTQSFAASTTSESDITPEQAEQRRLALLEAEVRDVAEDNDDQEAEDILRASTELVEANSGAVTDDDQPQADVETIYCGRRMCRIDFVANTEKDKEQFLLNLALRLQEITKDTANWNPPQAVYSDFMPGGQLAVKVYIPRSGETLPY